MLSEQNNLSRDRDAEFGGEIEQGVHDEASSIFKHLSDYCEFCLAHCSGVKVFCENAWMIFSSSSSIELTSLIKETTKLK